MPIPDSWNQVPVTGAYVRQDGSVPQGYVVFETMQRGIVIAGILYSPGTIRVKLVNGAIPDGFTLPSTDDVDLNITGWTYKVTEQFLGGREPFNIFIPHDSTGIDLRTAVPAAPPPEMESALSAAVIAAAQGFAVRAEAAALSAEGSGQDASNAAASEATATAAATTATGAASSATASALAASTSASQAGAAATLAGTHAGTASAAAGAASASAGTAQAAEASSQSIASQFGNVASAIAAAAASASAAAGSATGASGSATAAATSASSASVSAAAAAASIATGAVYADTALGVAAVAEGAYFSVPSVDSTEYLILYRKTSGAAVEVKRYPSAALVMDTATRVVDVDASQVPLIPFAVSDQDGNSALIVKADGVVEAPGLSLVGKVIGGMVLGEAESIEFEFAVSDAEGNTAFGVRKDGTLHIADDSWETLSIGDDDSIVHIGDSYTAAHYVPKDKAYISQLSALSPFRHQNFAISGSDALDMQYHIVNETVYHDGKTFSACKARYAFITTHTNDSAFRTADLTYFRENLHRLIEVVQGAGCEPILTTEFSAGLVDHALMRGIADRYGIGFIDCTSPNREVGTLDIGPFHQGHPGVRTGGVFWLPMLDYIDRMPRPDKAVKVFRRRATFTPAAAGDMLYNGRIDRNKKWKELTLSHMRLSDATVKHYDELNGPDVYTHVAATDEYRALEIGQAVAFGDYALIEVTLPGTAITLEAVELTMPGATGATIYVRDNLDPTTAPLGKAQGNTPANADYLAKWDKPRGAWRTLGVYGGPIVVTSLNRSMVGDTLVVMIHKAGGFNLTGLTVRYKGGGKKRLREPALLNQVGANLVTQPLCGNGGQLAGWTLTGAPTTLVPMDVSNAPRKPGTNTPVDGVCTISAANMIGQTLTLPASDTRKRYKMTVWARYFPKAFLDPSLYPGVDSAQIIDRIANPTDAPITSDTADLRTLKLEMWAGTTYPTEGGAEFTDFTPLFWRSIEFVIESYMPLTSNTTMSFRLSCLDGEIQIAKTTFREVQ